MPITDSRWAEEVLQEIVGRQLSSVEFVQDYVQLKFDGPGLTAVTQPTVERGSGVFHWNDPGFRDELCRCITRRVVSARIMPTDSVQIGFDDGATVKISLKPADYRAAEAVNYQARSVWWAL